MTKDQNEISAQELTRAKEAVAALLQHLGLEAYLFEVELRGGEWEVRLECAVDGGWQSVSLTAPHDALLESLQEPGVQERLARTWSNRLACLR
jgi:hypothetical protein